MVDSYFQGKLVGAAWKELGDEAKAKWEEKAEKDKARYKKEMESYSVPEGSDDSDENKGKDDKGKKKAKGRAKKDPNAPKRPMNAYMLFANSVRAKVREENPDMGMGDVVSLRTGSLSNFRSSRALCTSSFSNAFFPHRTNNCRRRRSGYGTRRSARRRGPSGRPRRTARRRLTRRNWPSTRRRSRMRMRSRSRRPRTRRKQPTTARRRRRRSSPNPSRNHRRRASRRANRTTTATATPTAIRTERMGRSASWVGAQKNMRFDYIGVWYEVILAKKKYLVNRRLAQLVHPSKLQIFWGLVAAPCLMHKPACCTLLLHPSA